MIVWPFVSEENHWIVKQHGIFQGYYFFHHMGLDRNMRDRYRDHPYWQACADFCASYDQNSFDPRYDTLPLEFFEPMVRRVFSSPKRSSLRSRSSPLRNASCAVSSCRIQLGSQTAPCSMTPNLSRGKRSRMPSMMSVATVSIGGKGIAMKSTERKFSVPPWKSVTSGRPFLK